MQFSTTGCTAVSYTDFEEITGGSRSLIHRGIEVLEAQGLIAKDTSSKTTVYQLADYVTHAGYARLAKRYLLRGEFGSRIAPLSLRNKTTLEGLKLYLLLAAFRDTKENQTLISYDKIESYMSIIRRNIRPAISILVEHRLIRCYGRDRISQDFDAHMPSPNAYAIFGLDDSDVFDDIENAADLESISTDSLESHL
jgi:hypothetical protein